MIVLAAMLLTPTAQADDDYPMMGPMMGRMGMGYMGMGPMMGGMGGMGMGPMMGGMGGMGCMGGMGGMMGMGRMMGGMGQQMVYMLDLSPEQRKQLRDINKKLRVEMLPLRDNMMEYNDELYELYDKEKPDAVKIGNVYRQIFDIKRRMIELHINARNRQYDVLTDEQKQQLKQMTSGMMGGFGGRRGMMQHMMH